MIDFSIIVTIKNRREHFVKVFPSLVTQQQPQSYQLLLVDYGSQDDLENSLKNMIQDYNSLFSDSLRLISRVCVEKDLPFNSGKAKNLGCNFSEGKILSFSDADVFLGMDYHRHWIQTLSLSHNCFFSSRVQETTKQQSRRLSSKTNYGNMIVEKSVFLKIGGFDENNPTWGGDDDDIIHRLKLDNYREINPHNIYESHHTSILHDDDVRTKFLESTEKNKELAKDKFEKIYSNNEAKNINFLSFYNANKDIVKVENLYERS